MLLFLSLQRGCNKRPNAYYLCNDAYRGLLLFAALQHLQESINAGLGMPLYSMRLRPRALLPLSCTVPQRNIKVRLSYEAAAAAAICSVTGQRQHGEAEVKFLFSETA